MKTVMTKKIKEKVLDMYLRNYEHIDIMKKLNVTKKQIFWIINQYVASSITPKELVKEQRIEKAYLMEKNIFDRIEKGQSIRGYDSIFFSFCA